MPEAGGDLALLKDAAQAAGDIARRYFRHDPRTWTKPDGAGPVTEADLAVNAMLREELTRARPEFGWLSEESEDDPARLEADHLFIVDPIDGTRAFIKGDPAWAISLAVAEKGRVTSAVVYLPARDKLYAAAAGAGAWLGTQRIRASDRAALDGAAVLAPSPAFEAMHWKDARPPRVDRQFRSSLAYRLSLIGEGRFDAMLTLRATWEWDIAAGSLIVAEAGGIATDRRLHPLRFNNPGAQVNGVVAAGARLHPLLGARLSQA